MGGMEPLPFVKMHGLGNDFVVLDGRGTPVVLSAAQVRAIAARRTGVGCDQLVVIEPSARGDAFMRIYNSDGGEVEACGNATRCVAAELMKETGRDRVTIETAAGLLVGTAAADGAIAVDMGEPGLGWRDIPLAREMDTLHLGLGPFGPLSDPVGVNVGNPHAVFFLADAEAVDLESCGPVLEHDPLFPERTNISVAEVRPEGSIRLRVWERGVGITRACGTAACATLVAAVRRALIPGREADIELDGGVLHLAWGTDNRVIMTGPVALGFRGTIAPALLEGAV